MLIVVTLDMAIRGKKVLSGGGQLGAGLLILFHIICGILIIFPSILCLGLFSLFLQTLRSICIIEVVLFVSPSHCNCANNSII